MSDIRQMGEGEDLHSQRTMFMPAGQMEQSEDSSGRTEFDPQNNAPQAQQNASEDHGTLEPNDSRNVTGASGSAGVGAPGGSDQQSGGERWGGGQQGQTETPDASGQQQAEDVEFEADPSIERQGEVEFEQSGDSGGGQQQQYDSSSGGQMGGGSEGVGGRFASQIREHMHVIGADGVRLGTVDKVEGDRIKLIKADSGQGSHQGHHHFIGRALVADVEGDQVRLSANSDVALAFEEEDSGAPR